ncbi:hypothetical protein ACWCHM_21740 [Micromonospora sp. SCSIO 07396]
MATSGGIAAGQIGTVSIGLQHRGASDRARSVEDLILDGSILLHPLDQYDPVADLGVHPPIQVDGRPRLTPYVDRSVDANIDACIQAGGLVLLEGDSSAGKTRSAYEAATRWFAANADWVFLRARDGAALRRAVEARFTFNRTVIWLDDLENYLTSGGLDGSLVRAILPPGKTDVVLLATIRSAAKSAFQGDPLYPDLPTFAPDTRRVFALAQVVRLSRELTSSEWAKAEKLREDPRIAAALDNEDGVGLAEHLSAGPATVERWLSGRHGVSPWGAALISAVIDFRRAGYLAPVPRSWLKRAATSYVGKREARRFNHLKFSAALAWATQPVRGASACLEEVEDGKYLAFDYLVDHTQSQASREELEARENGESRHVLSSVPDDVWHTISDELMPGDPQYLSCVSASTLSPHPGLAWMFKKGIENGVLDLSEFNNEGHLFGLAQVCMRSHVCIVCQMIDLNLDLPLLVRLLIDAVEPLFSGRSCEVSLRQRDSLQMLNEFAEDDHFNNRDAPIFKAVTAADPKMVAEVGRLLRDVGAEESGNRWLSVAEQIGPD